MRPAGGAPGDDQWLTLDLGGVQTIRAVELRTRGHVVLLRQTFRVEASVDGSNWTLVSDEPTGGLALAGSLREPLAVPVRAILPDVQARYLRIGAPAFNPAAVTVYGPG